MVRQILAVLAALAVAMATFLAVEQLGNLMFPMPLGLNMEDKIALKDFMDGRPVASYLIVLGGWLLGSILAGFVLQKISQQKALVLPLIVGVLLTASAVLNFYLLPHPTWFVVCGVLAFIPSVLIGWNLAERMADKRIAERKA